MEFVISVTPWNVYILKHGCFACSIAYRLLSIDFGAPFGTSIPRTIFKPGHICIDMIIHMSVRISSSKQILTQSIDRPALRKQMGEFELARY